MVFYLAVNCIPGVLQLISYHLFLCMVQTTAALFLQVRLHRYCTFQD